VRRAYVAQTEIHKQLIAQIVDPTAAFFSPNKIWRRSWSLLVRHCQGYIVTGQESNT